MRSTTDNVFKHRYKNSDDQVHGMHTEKVSAQSEDLETKVKMGWFNSAGKRRWGIEIVDPRQTHDAMVMAGGLRHESETSIDFQLPIHGERESFSVPVNESLRQRSFSTGVRDRSASIRRAGTRSSNTEEGMKKMGSAKREDDIGRLHGVGMEGGLERKPSLAFSFDTVAVREQELKKAPSPAPAGDTRWYDSVYVP